MEIGLVHYLSVAAVLFGLGLFTVMTRKNSVGILLGVELILNAAALNFVAFSHYVEGNVGGQVFAVFIIVLAAAEAAIALMAILVKMSLGTAWPLTEEAVAPTTARLGDAFLKEWLLPFELASLVLLMALVGAMVIARRAAKEVPKEIVHDRLLG